MESDGRLVGSMENQASVRPIGDAINLMYIGLFFLGAGT